MRYEIPKTKRMKLKYDKYIQFLINPMLETLIYNKTYFEMVNIRVKK